MRAVLVALGLALPSCQQASIDDPTDATTGGIEEGAVTIATFNVRRLFDTNCQSGACGSGDFEETPSDAQFEARIAQLATAITGLEADLVLLQEVENRIAVDALQAALSDLYGAAVVGELGYPASLDVAVLSREPASSVLTHADDPLPLPGGGQTTFTREFLELHFTIASRDVAVFNAHFKSKRDDDPDRRLAEAVRAEEIVTARADAWPDGLVVFGGDLNDVPASMPLAAIEASGTLLRVAAELDDDSTYQYEGAGEAIDHLYVSTLATGGAYVPGTVEVVPAPAAGYGGSDHAALRATFELGDHSP